MNIKKGDTVLIIAGKDRGVKGKVIDVLPKKERVVIDGANKMYRYTKPRMVGEKGERVEFFGSVHISNVQLIDEKTKKPTRIGKKALKDGKKVRVSKKSNEVIDK